MGADGHKVCSELSDIKRNFTEGLHGIDVEKDIEASYYSIAEGLEKLAPAEE